MERSVYRQPLARGRCPQQDGPAWWMWQRTGGPRDSRRRRWRQTGPVRVNASSSRSAALRTRPGHEPRIAAGRLSQMDAVGVDRERQVGVVVDDQQGATLLCDGPEPAAEPVLVSFEHVLLAHLNDIGATLQGGFNDPDGLLDPAGLTCDHVQAHAIEPLAPVLARCLHQKSIPPSSAECLRAIPSAGTNLVRCLSDGARPRLTGP